MSVGRSVIVIGDVGVSYSVKQTTTKDWTKSKSKVVKWVNEEWKKNIQIQLSVSDQWLGRSSSAVINSQVSEWVSSIQSKQNEKEKGKFLFC